MRRSVTLMTTSSDEVDESLLQVRINGISREKVKSDFDEGERVYSPSDPEYIRYLSETKSSSLKRSSMRRHGSSSHFGSEFREMQRGRLTEPSMKCSITKRRPEPRQSIGYESNQTERTRSSTYDFDLIHSSSLHRLSSYEHDKRTYEYDEYRKRSSTHSSSRDARGSNVTSSRYAHKSWSSNSRQKTYITLKDEQRIRDEREGPYRHRSTSRSQSYYEMYNRSSERDFEEKRHHKDASDFDRNSELYRSDYSYRNKIPSKKRRYCTPSPERRLRQNSSSSKLVESRSKPVIRRSYDSPSTFKRRLRRDGLVKPKYSNDAKGDDTAQLLTSSSRKSDGKRSKKTINKVPVQDLSDRKSSCDSLEDKDCDYASLCFDDFGEAYIKNTNKSNGKSSSITSQTNSELDSNAVDFDANKSPNEDNSTSSFNKVRNLYSTNVLVKDSTRNHHAATVQRKSKSLPPHMKLDATIHKRKYERRNNPPQKNYSLDFMKKFDVAYHVPKKLQRCRSLPSISTKHTDQCILSKARSTSTGLSRSASLSRFLNLPKWKDAEDTLPKFSGAKNVSHQSSNLQFRHENLFDANSSKTRCRSLPPQSHIFNLPLSSKLTVSSLEKMQSSDVDFEKNAEFPLDQTKKRKCDLLHNKPTNATKKLKLSKGFNEKKREIINIIDNCQSRESTESSNVLDRDKSNIVIRNLSPSVENKMLHRIFSRFGDITSHKVATDGNGRSIGFGYVRFKRVESAMEAIKTTNGLELEGKKLAVEKFLPVGERYKRRPYEKSEDNSSTEEIFRCTPEVAKFIFERYGLQSLTIGFSFCEDGIKLTGVRRDVNQLILLLSSKQFQTHEIKFLSPRLSKEFKSREWKSLLEKLKKYRCSLFVVEPKPVVKTCLKIEVSRAPIMDLMLNEDIPILKPLSVKWDAVIKIVAEQSQPNEGHSAGTTSEADKVKVEKSQIISISFDICNVQLEVVADKSVDIMAERMIAKLREARSAGARNVVVVPFDSSTDLNCKIPLLCIARGLKQALTQFKDEQVQLVSEGSRTSYLESIEIVLINNPELISMFPKLALPSSDHHKLLGEPAEKATIVITGNETRDVEKVVDKVKKYKNEILRKVHIDKKILSKLEENEIVEIDSLTKKAAVFCYLAQKEEPVMVISGLKKRVKKVEQDVDKILKELDSALLYSKLCVWKWESKSHHFERLPLRVAAVLEKQKEDMPTKDVAVTICGKEVTVLFSTDSYKAFNGKFNGKIIREDVGGCSSGQINAVLSTTKAQNANAFVVQPPKINSEKLKYLESILSARYKSYSAKKINELFESNKRKGQIAVSNEGVVVITKTIDSYLECCKLLDTEIHLASVHTPTGRQSSEISEASLKPLLKSFKLKWLGFDCRDDAVVTASFEKSDVTKACDEIRKLAEKFLISDVYKCECREAIFIVKYYSKIYTNVKLELVDDGVKLTGSKNKIKEVMDLLRSKIFFNDKFSFVAPDLSSYFPESMWCKKMIATIESKLRCSVQINQNKELPVCDTTTSNTKISFEVSQGDISDETADAIVNGVSQSFDLNWGKISPAVLGKAGNELQIECSSNPLIFTNCLRVTKGYNLSCKYVFHLVTPNSAQDLTKRVKICLDEAQKLGITSISFPTLGAGGIGLDAAVVGSAFLEAFEEFQQSNSSQTSLTKVRIVVFEPTLVDVFKLFVTATATSIENQVLFSGIEEWLVSVTSNRREDLDKALEYLSSQKSSLLKEVKLEDDFITKLEKHDIAEIKEISQQEKVQCIIKAEFPELNLSGIKRNVNAMIPKVKTLLTELDEALVYSNFNMWMWEEESDQKFTPLPLRVSRALASLQKKGSKDAKIDVCGETFRVDFSALTLTSEKDRRVCKICEKEQKDSPLPDDWSPMNGKSIRRVSILANTSEYKKVKDRFFNTTPNGTIVKVQRIQNEVLYKHYLLQKKDIEKHMQSTKDVERELFHGTSRDDAVKICSLGFDRGFAGKNATMYGKGTYFALNSCYSSSYSPQDSSGCKYMFLAQVLTGNYCAGGGSMVAAPPLPGSNRLYDSVVDNVSSPSMFIVFRDY